MKDEIEHRTGRKIKRKEKEGRRGLYFEREME